MSARDMRDIPLISYIYERPDDVRLNVAHGVWGGINPHGEIEMNFYNESDKLPRFTVQSVAPDGSMGEEKIPDEQSTEQITRHIHSRVLLNYDTARAILEWLEDRVAELENESRNNFFPHNSGIEQ